MTFPRQSETDSSAVGFKGREREAPPPPRRGVLSTKICIAAQRSSPLHSAVSPPEATVSCRLRSERSDGLSRGEQQAKARVMRPKRHDQSAPAFQPGNDDGRAGPCHVRFLIRLLPSKWRGEEKKEGWGSGGGQKKILQRASHGVKDEALAAALASQRSCLLVTGV